MTEMALQKVWTRMRSSALIQDAAMITFWNAFAKGIGFMVPFFIAAWFGVSAQTDAFFVAYGLILFLATIFAPVVQSVIVPYIAEARAKGEDIGQFVGGVLGISAFALFIFAAGVLLVARPVLILITQFDAGALNLISQLLLETAPLIILLVWTSILAGSLNAYKHFFFPAVHPAFRAVINLSLIFALKDRIGVHAIALGYLTGEIASVAILMCVLKRLNLFRLRLSLHCPAKLKKFFQTASYQVIGMAALSLSPFIDKIMASWLEAGSVSVLHYADRLYMIPITLGTGVLVALLSHWSGRFYRHGSARLKQDLNRVTKPMAGIALALTVVLILLHSPIVKAAFGRGAFAQDRLPEVGWVWVCYLLGFVPYILTQVYVQGHITLKNTKILMWCDFYMVILNIVLNLILMHFWQTAGIALATTCVSIFTLFYLRNAFYKNVNTNI